MTLYTADAVRDGRWWPPTVDGVGATQSRSLKDAPDAVRGLVSAMQDADPSTVEVTIHPQIGTDLLEHVEAARESVVRAARLQADAAAQSRAAARELLSIGLTGKDIATILDVSPQRVSQLLAS